MARQDPASRLTALILATTIAVAQVGWTIVAVLHLPVGVLIPALVVLYMIELGGPVLTG